MILGIPLSRLDAKLVEIRGYQINWQSYYQTQVISQAACDFISSLDEKKSVKERNELFSQNLESVLCIPH